MNTRDAMTACQRLFLMCGTWDEAQTRAWLEEVTQLEDPDAAREASATTVRTWTSPGRPPFATWLDAYNQARRRRIESGARPAIGGARRDMPPSEAIAGLLEAARRGNRSALDDLGNWWRNVSWARQFLDADELERLGVDMAERPGKGNLLSGAWLGGAA